MKKHLVTFGLLLCAACSSSPPPEEGNAAAAGAPAAGTQAPAKARGRGYFHEPAKSRFALGAAMREEPWHLGTRLVGSDGTLATTATGATFAVLDADAKERLLNDGPFTNDPAVHEAHVLAYFVANGLPADQVGERGVLTLMTKSGTIDESPSAKPGVFRAYTTVLHRVVAGFRVENSYASASFNRNGEVTAEAVYWPEIPEAVIDEAAALRAKLSDRTVHAAFKARTAHEADYEDGEVMIHHTAATDPALSFFASVDFHGHVDVSGAKATATTRSYRIDGAEVLPPAPVDPVTPKAVQFR